MTKKQTDLWHGIKGKTIIRYSNGYMASFKKHDYLIRQDYFYIGKLKYYFSFFFNGRHERVTYIQYGYWKLYEPLHSCESKNEQVLIDKDNISNNVYLNVDPGIMHNTMIQISKFKTFKELKDQNLILFSSLFNK